MEIDVTVFLKFPLDIQDDWPPVSTESLPFESLSEGYKALQSPLFTKGLSVGDIIFVEEDVLHNISSWLHLQKSQRTTIWILRIADTDEIEVALNKLRLMGCNTVGLQKFGCYAVDVPAEVKISDVDNVLSRMDADRVAIAFPSMRHPDG